MRFLIHSELKSPQQYIVRFVQNIKFGISLHQFFLFLYTAEQETNSNYYTNFNIIVVHQ